MRRIGRGLVVVVAVVAAASFISACGEDDAKKESSDERLNGLVERLGDTAVLAARADCDIEAPTIQVPEHVDSIDGVDYSSDPPTSGNHLNEWGAWGLYDETLPMGNAIHHLEHGGVVLWLGDDIAQERIDAIENDVLDTGEKWVVSPRPGTKGIDATGWGQLMSCESKGLEKLSDEEWVDLLNGWFDATNSQGSEQEKVLPAYAGELESPKPDPDLSIEP